MGERFALIRLTININKLSRNCLLRMCFLHNIHEDTVSIFPPNVNELKVQFTKMIKEKISSSDSNFIKTQSEPVCERRKRK